MECDRIVVKAFQSRHEVASFRASKLSDDFYIKKAEFERKKTQLNKDDITRDPTRDLLTGIVKVQCLKKTFSVVYNYVGTIRYN